MNLIINQKVLKIKKLWKMINKFHTAFFLENYQFREQSVMLKLNWKGLVIFYYFNIVKFLIYCYFFYSFLIGGNSKVIIHNPDI